MSLLTASTAIVFFFGFAAAQITAPTCSPTWKWSFNSLSQDPCLMTAYMYSTCSGGSYEIDPLPKGYHYSGPWKGIDERNLCECSTVGYSLISACAGCQGNEWGTWSQYVTNCTTILPPSAFPNPIPAGIRIPQWALLDVTNENDWNFNKSYLVGDSPELGPGSILGPKSSSLSASSARPTSTLATSSTAASSTAASNTATPIPAGGHSSNAGAIAGGIAGGIGAISILVAALLFYLRRRRSQAKSAPFVVDDSMGPMGQVPWPMSGRETATSLPETSSSPKPYDPSDPTTFPSKYEGIPDSPYVPARVTSLSSNNTLCTTAAMPGPNAVGYHGLPTV